MRENKENYYENNRKRDTVFAILIVIPIIVGIYALISGMYMMLISAIITASFIALMTELVEKLDNIRENTEHLRDYIEKKEEAENGK